MGNWQARARDGRWQWRPLPLTPDEQAAYTRFQELGQRFMQGSLGHDDFVEASDCLQQLLVPRLVNMDYRALSVQEQIDVGMAFTAIMDELLMLEPGDTIETVDDGLDVRSVLAEAERILRGRG